MKKGYMLFKEVMNVNGNKVGFNEGCIMIQLNTNERLAGRFREFEEALGMSRGELLENYIDYVYTSNDINEVTIDDISFEHSTLMDVRKDENVGVVCLMFDSYISPVLQKYTQDFFNKLLINEYGIDSLSRKNYIEDDYYIDEDYDTFIINGYEIWHNEPAEKYIHKIDEILNTSNLTSAEIELIEELKLWPQNEVHKDWNLVERWYYGKRNKFNYDQRENRIKEFLNNESLSDEQAEFLAYLNYRFVENFFLRQWKQDHRLYYIGLSSKKEREKLQKKHSKKK